MRSVRSCSGLLLLVMVLAVGCGGEDESGADGGTSDVVDTRVTVDTGDDGTSAALDPDHCKDDSDCGGFICTQVADAARVCVRMLELYKDACPANPGPDDCCEDTDCTAGQGGVCVSAMIGYCGGVGPGQSNQCHYVECHDDADCGAGKACLPGGYEMVVSSTCVEAACTSDADCSARAGGRCSVLASDRTCPGTVVACTYDDSPCRKPADCANGELCVASQDRQDASCETELMMP